MGDTIHVNNLLIRCKYRSAFSMIQCVAIRQHGTHQVLIISIIKDKVVKEVKQDRKR